MDVSYRNVSVDIGGTRIVSGIDLEVGAGGFVGIVGPNGSGKSTTLRCLYRALAPAQQPHVLVLDEPTNHLDVRHQYSILSSARTLGITVIAALHDLNLAAQYCDTIHVMAEGHVVLSGSPDQVITTESIGRWFGIGCHVIAHPRSGVPQIIFDAQPERQDKE